MTNEEKEKIRSHMEPLYVRENEDSVTLYFPGTRPYKKNYLGEISITILRVEEGKYWVIGHNVLGYLMDEDRYLQNEKAREGCDRVLKELGVTRVPEIWDSVYFEIDRLSGVDGAVFRMLGIVAAVQWWTHMFHAYTGKEKQEQI